MAGYRLIGVPKPEAHGRLPSAAVRRSSVAAMALSLQIRTTHEVIRRSNPDVPARLLAHGSGRLDRPGRIGRGRFDAAPWQAAGMIGGQQICQAVNIQARSHRPALPSVGGTVPRIVGRLQHGRVVR